MKPHKQQKLQKTVFKSRETVSSAQKPLQIFSRLSFAALKITPIKLIKHNRQIAGIAAKEDLRAI